MSNARVMIFNVCVRNAPKKLHLYVLKKVFSVIFAMYSVCERVECVVEPVGYSLMGVLPVRRLLTIRSGKCLETNTT